MLWTEKDGKMIPDRPIVLESSFSLCPFITEFYVLPGDLEDVQHN